MLAYSIKNRQIMNMINTYCKIKKLIKFNTYKYQSNHEDIRK